MIVPFQRPRLPEPDAVERYLAASRAEHRFANEGPCWQLLRSRLEAIGGAACVPTASATVGLILALRALRERETGPASIALMPSFTFAATAQAAAWNGLEPVFVDVAPSHWHVDPDALAAALASRRGAVAAIVAVSAFGTPPPPAVRERWRELADEHGVPLVVDSAGGFGAVAQDGRPIGSQGDVEVVSFHATKPLAAGEGGAVFSADPELVDRVRRLSNFGFDESRQATSERGINGKLSEQAAATALAALDELDDSLAARRTRARRILDALDGEVTPQEGCAHGAWQFVPVRARDRARRDRVLAAAGGSVELRTYYEPLHRMPAFRAVAAEGGLAATEALADSIVSLPMAVDLDDRELELIVDAVRAGNGGERPANGHARQAAGPGPARGRTARLTASMHERAARWPERLAELRRSPEWQLAYSESEPLITGRIATWNRAELVVERAIASVRRQTYPNWELIVVGDACTDDTGERIAALGDERISFHNLPVRGPYPEEPFQRYAIAGIPGMNLGATLARGRWIAPLDDDDEWDDDHLEVLLGAARESGAELAYGRVRRHRAGAPRGEDFGAWPPPAQVSMGAAIYNAALREFKYDLACRFLSEAGDQNLVRRLWEAGVRFHFLDRAVATFHSDHAVEVLRSARAGRG